MSVSLKSKRNDIEVDMSNGTWAAIISLGRAYEGDRIPNWDGSNDPQTWTPEELNLMASRLAQTAEFVEDLKALAANGGATLS